MYANENLDRTLHMPPQTLLFSALTPLSDQPTSPTPRLADSQSE